MWDCSNIGERLSGYLDGELTQGDRQRVELHLERCSKCRAAYDELACARRAVSELTYDQLSQQEWRDIMQDVTVRASRGFGWLFYVSGLVVLVCFGGWQFAIDEAVPALIKTSVAAILLGTVLLFLSVLRERMLSRKTDKYEDVQI
jgi:hypothetical protein